MLFQSTIVFDAVLDPVVFLACNVKEGNGGECTHSCLVYSQSADLQTMQQLQWWVWDASIHRSDALLMVLNILLYLCLLDSPD